VKVYDRTEADLPMDGITNCVKEYAGYKPDVVLGIGGGSCMDMAKCVAVLLQHGGSLRDYYGENKIPGPVAPVIAVPTTSGTGSEVTPVAVIADTERGTKVGISSPYLIPRVAVCDPELTLTCPPGLTAVSGADALTHAIESYTAARREVTADLTVKNVFVGKNALSDMFGLLALKNIFEALPTAVKDGKNIAAREKMMLASLAAGCAFGTAGTAAAHAIQYPVGNETHTPHGMGVALLMPYVMEFNRPACVGGFAEIARGIGLNGKDDEDLSKKLIDAVAALLAKIKIPVTLKELGLPEDKQDWTAEAAIGAARLVGNNPRKLDVDALKAITRAAFTGDRASLAS
jgi:alcohol dehydrogenase class IV